MIMMQSEMLALSKSSTLTCTMVAGVAVSKKTSMMVLSTAKEAKNVGKLGLEGKLGLVICCILCNNAGSCWLHCDS